MSILYKNARNVRLIIEENLEYLKNTTRFSLNIRFFIYFSIYYGTLSFEFWLWLRISENIFNWSANNLAVNVHVSLLLNA